MTLTKWSPEEFRRKAAWRVANVIRDTPLSILTTFREDVSPEKMNQLLSIHDAPYIDAAIPLVTEEIVSLYPNAVNSPKRLIEILKERVKLGYRSLNFEALPGEETTLLRSLTSELIDELHAVN
jgi:hypothetical protein